MVSAATFAVVQAGVIVNAVIAAPDVAAERGWIPMPAGAWIGWTSGDGGNTWQPPTPPVTVTVTAQDGTVL